jgi:hypothetical protein
VITVKVIKIKSKNTKAEKAARVASGDPNEF